MRHHQQDMQHLKMQQLGPAHGLGAAARTAACQQSGLLALDQLLHQLLLFVSVSGLLCLQSYPDCHHQQPM